MAVIFFSMNIWPAFLLTPNLAPIEKEDAMKQELMKTGSHISSAHKSRLMQDAIEQEVAHNSRMILSVRGSNALDMVIPVTQEHKMYLAEIDEDDDEEDNSSSKY